jgi:endonuclease/exonuclease/phosphatase family metal-dependent hydrolase
VCTYNLFWWNAFDQNPWKSNEIVANIKDQLKPDVIGFQEVDSPSDIQRRTGLQPASKFAAAQGVMVAPGLFVTGDSGSQDLQATGKWGARYVTWVQLTHEATGRRFWHFNTHWCVQSGNGRTCNEEVRYEGAKNMLKLIREKAGSDPVVVTGDFNANMNERGPQHFVESGLKLAVSNWVDAIFYSDHWQLTAQGVGDRAQSDHRPVFAELELS